MHGWMKRHLGFLEENREWFARVFATYPTRCSAVADALSAVTGCSISRLQMRFCWRRGTAGFPQRRGSRLPPGHKSPRISSSMRSPGLIPRFCCTVCPIASWIGFFESARSPRCPLLGSHDECLVYECRPLACRLEGAPMVDSRDGPFGTGAS